MFCPKCGARNKDGARFCGSCGEPLSGRKAPSAQAGATHAPGGAPSGAAPSSTGTRTVAPGTASSHGRKRSKAPAIAAVAAVAVVAAAVAALGLFGVGPLAGPLGGLLGGGTFHGTLTLESGSSTFRTTIDEDTVAIELPVGTYEGDIDEVDTESEEGSVIYRLDNVKLDGELITGDTGPGMADLTVTLQMPRNITASDISGTWIMTLRATSSSGGGALIQTIMAEADEDGDLTLYGAYQTGASEENLDWADPFARDFDKDVLAAQNGAVDAKWENTGDNEFELSANEGDAAFTLTVEPA